MKQILRFLLMLVLLSGVMVIYDELVPGNEVHTSTQTSGYLDAGSDPSDGQASKGQDSTELSIQERLEDKETSPKPTSPILNEARWAARMSLPSEDAVAAYRTTQRSPYIVCRPQFANTNGYTEYAVDFKVDSLPRGTYLSICNWDMDLNGLATSYSEVHRDYSGVAAYAGFQLLSDGTTVAIMSVWDTYVTDSSGTSSIIHATRTYPDSYLVSKPFAGEGSGIQTLVSYAWQPGKTYRALIQCGQTETGTCELQFYVCDLEAGRWDKLIAYDLGYGNTHMTSACVFLEDYDVNYAADVRTMELSNFRACSVGDGSWVSAHTATFEQNYEYPGSYAYGSDDSCFWAITSGIPSLCACPADGAQFSVSDAQAGSPY